MKPTPIILATAALAVGAWSLLNPTTQAAQKLLPFQGRLTDATGEAVSDGPKVVQFKIYDAPTGGTAVWNGEVQKVTVNGGLVSTLLGSKADLSAVDFNQALYLEITVDANADNQITAADPPLLPRQSILPAVFAVEAQSARDSQKLGGYDWSAIIDNGNPSTGKVPLNKVSVPAGSIPATAITPDSITASQIAANAVDTVELKDSSVTSTKILNGSITKSKLEPMIFASSETADWIEATRDLVNWFATPLAASITTSGRPVMIALTPRSGSENSFVQVNSNGAEVFAGGELRFMRGAVSIGGTTTEYRDNAQQTSRSLSLPPSSYWFIDTPPAGTYNYTIQMRGNYKRLYSVKLLVFEL